MRRQYVCAHEMNMATHYTPRVLSGDASRQRPPWGTDAHWYPLGAGADAEVDELANRQVIYGVLPSWAAR